MLWIYLWYRSTLDSTGAFGIIIHMMIFTFLDDMWTVGYTAALDNTGFDNDSVCGSSSGGEDDDGDDDDNSGAGFGDCEYLECSQTDNDAFNTYWLPVGCLNSEGYYGKFIMYFVKEVQLILMRSRFRTPMIMTSV